MPRFLLATALLALTLAASSFAQAAPPDAPAGDLVEEVHRINVTLQAIQQLLEKQVETQSLDLLLKRSDLAARELSQFESRLRKAEDERRSLASDKARIETQIKAMEAELDSNSPKLEEEEMDFITAQIEGERTRTNQRLAELDREITELQNQLAARRKELQGWRDLTDRRLGGL